MYMHVHSRIAHNEPRVETYQVSISGWLDKQYVLFAYNGILLNHKKG